MDRILSVPLIVVTAAVLIAAVTDVWKFRVHNLLTLPLLLTGLIYNTVVGGMSEIGWAGGLLNSVFGVLCGSGVLLLLYLMGGMGAGDVKLMAGVGAWLALPLTLYVFIASVLVAAVYAVVLVVANGRIRETWLNFQIIWHRVCAIGRHLGADDRVEQEVNRGDRRRRVVPFAAMIAVGLVGLLILSLIGVLH